DDVEVRERRRADHRATTERAAQVADGQPLGEPRVDDRGTDGQPGGEALREGQRIGHDTIYLGRREGAGSSHTALDLVEDERRAGPGADLARGLEEFRRE